MNRSPLFKTIHRAINCIAPKIFSLEPVTNVINRRLHSVCNKQYSNMLSSTYESKPGSMTLLQPSLPIYNSICGLKMKGKLQLRCKSCYFFWRNERRYVFCREHPRHKQVQVKKRDYKTWILTSASQSPKRAW